MERPLNAANSPSDRQPNWALRRGVSVLITAGAIVGLAIVVLVVVLTRGSSSDPPATPFPSAVLAVVPAPDAQAPRQGPIGARVAQGWVATISIDGVPIPDSQLTSGTRQLNEYFFTPGEGKVIETVQPGRTCAQVVATSLVDTNSPPVSFSWCFTNV